MKEFTPVWAWVILGVVLVISFCVDITNTVAGGSIDLRNRVTGARTMMADIPPYHYKWHEPEPPEYCDVYNNPVSPVNKVTATPTGLLLLVPYASLDYASAQLFWFFTQWALLLGTTWLWLRRCENFQQWILIAGITAGFTYTAAWRLHAERGQAYVLLLFIFAGWLLLTLNSKRENGFLTGCIAGLLIALRPPLLLLVPFLALHLRGQLAGTVVGLLVSAGLPALINHAAWTDYFSAMHDYSGIYTSIIDIPARAQAYPDVVEGIPIDILGHIAVIPYADFSAFSLLRIMGLLSFPTMPVLLVIVVPFGIWLWLTREQPAERLLAALAAWFFLVDLFLPAYRNNYNDVLILNIAALGILSSLKIPWGAWPCLIALPIGWVIYGMTVHQAWIIDIPSFLYMVGAILFIFLPVVVPPPRKR